MTSRQDSIHLCLLSSVAFSFFCVFCFWLSLCFCQNVFYFPLTFFHRGELTICEKVCVRTGVEDLLRNKAVILKQRIRLALHILVWIISEERFPIDSEPTGLHVAYRRAGWFFSLFELRQNDNQFVWIHCNKHSLVSSLIDEWLSEPPELLQTRLNKLPSAKLGHFPLHLLWALKIRWNWRGWQ